MDKKNYIIVKDRHPRFSEVLNDCCSTLCVPASKDEPLSSILSKLCNKINAQKITFTNKGNVHFTMNGTQVEANFIEEEQPEDDNIYLREDLTVGAYHVAEANVVAQSASDIFFSAHGTTTAKGKMYIGTRAQPSRIAVFKDPNNLSDAQYVTLTDSGVDEGYVESMCYDSVNDKLYATSSKDGGQTLRILQINPDDITDWSVVLDDPSIVMGGSPTICTDGEFVYGCTYDAIGFGQGPLFFKIRISDWTVVLTKEWEEGCSAHGSALRIYADRTEMYVSDAFCGNIAKVNCADLSYVHLDLPPESISITDDVYFRYMDETGGYLYVGGELGGHQRGYRVDTRDMTYTAFWCPNTYGMFSDGTHLYAGCYEDSAIMRYPNFDITKPEFYRVVGGTHAQPYQPNEMFFLDGKIFATDWGGSTSLIQVELDNSVSYADIPKHSLSIGPKNNLAPYAAYSLVVGLDNEVNHHSSVVIGKRNTTGAYGTITVGNDLTNDKRNSILLWNRFFVDDNNGVGIGTKEPLKPFHHAGDGIVAGGPTARLGIGKANEVSARVLVDMNSTPPAAPASASGSITVLSTPANGDSWLANNNNAKIRVYTYKNTLNGRVYSTSYAESPTVVDSGNGEVIEYNWTWAAVPDITGYLVVGYNEQNGMNYDFFNEEISGNILPHDSTMENWQDFGGTLPFGVTGALIAVQTDGTFKATGVPTYANEAAAVTGGLTTGTIYKTATGELRIKL